MTTATSNHTPLPADEYERRRTFCDLLKTMRRSEHIEIARILRKNGVPMSENRSGLFVDVARLDQAVFSEIVKFHQFVQQNNEELEKRDVSNSIS